jgi:hypothetical protein
MCSCVCSTRTMQSFYWAGIHIFQEYVSYHSLLECSKAVLFIMQKEAVEALIQELPKFRLKAVPTDCSECPICLEEFHVGNEVILF